MRTYVLVMAVMCAAACGRDHTPPPTPEPAPVAAPSDAAIARVAPADAPAPRATVVRVAGKVERRVGDLWSPVALGQKLDERDALRTADGATARLDVSGETVELAGRTEITVGELSATVASVVLSEGRVSADGQTNRVFRIAVRDLDTVAEATAGKFDVLATKRFATFAAESGHVTVSAHGASVNVHAGEQSTVLAGAVPQAPIKIPPSLFLKVSAANAGAMARLHGETTPGAVVRVNGAALPVTGGTIDADVPLKDGKNVIVVLVEDATGHHATKVIERVLDDKPPSLATEVDWE